MGEMFAGLTSQLGNAVDQFVMTPEEQKEHDRKFAAQMAKATQQSQTQTQSSGMSNTMIFGFGGVVLLMLFGVVYVSN